MASPYTLSAITDIALSDSVENIFADQRGIQLAAASMVLIALNAESVDVTAGVNIGGEQALKDGSTVTVQATVGVLPILPDDQMVVTFGKQGNQITVSGRNADGAAARELRGIVRVFEMDDFIAAEVVDRMRAAGLGLRR